MPASDGRPVVSPRAAGDMPSAEGGDAAADAMASVAEEMARLRATTKARNEVRETLLRLDINATTPIEALGILNELKRKVQG